MSCVYALPVTLKPCAAKPGVAKRAISDFWAAVPAFGDPALSLSAS